MLPGCEKMTLAGTLSLGGVGRACVALENQAMTHGGRGEELVQALEGVVLCRKERRGIEEKIKRRGRRNKFSR